MSFPIPKIIRLEVTDSTNKEAFRHLAHEELPEGSVIWASHQIAGQGHGGTSWESEPGKNLLFSLILYPEFLPPDRQFRLNQVISIGTMEGITAFSGLNGFCIKWPNDIYFRNGKVSGMLIENSILGNKFQVSVVGIGINLNQQVFTSKAPNPLSLRNIAGKEFDLQQALNEVIGRIMHWYQQLKSGQFIQIEETYYSNLLGYQTERQFRDEKGVFSGKIKGVDKHGRLLIITSNGKQLAFELKQVRFL
jgi:BirA family biotin operon repressor/biotin-[acetyl-CoA-carboxylase] ligase